MNNTIFVDTNYFIRLIDGDVPSQVKIVEKLLLEGANGKVKLYSSTIVLFEIYWVMKKLYHRDKNDLQRVLADVLRLNFITWSERVLLEKCIEQMSNHNFDLEDTYNLEYAKENKITELASFDEKLQKLWKK
jgi:predicted nucleic acid-binding protein